MTNTTQNVPRELLERAATSIEQRMCIQCEGVPCCMPESLDTLSDIRALLSAPSPVGVDGLEVVGWYRMDDRKAITPYPSVCATWHKMGVKVGAAYSDSAHAIIDGLRGENERIRLNIAEYNEAIACYQSQRDQQAQRIGELEGLLQHASKYIAPGAVLTLIRSTLSAGKDSAP